MWDLVEYYVIESSQDDAISKEIQKKGAMSCSLFNKLYMKVSSQQLEQED